MAKRVVQLVVLGGAIALLSFWLTRDPPATDSGALRRDAQGAGPLEPGDARLRGRADAGAAALDRRHGYTLRGLVVDEDGTPLPGVAVALEHRPSRPRHRHVSWREFDIVERGRERRTPVGDTRADGEGRFTFAGLRPREDYICTFAPAPPFVGTERWIRRWTSSDLEMRFVLRRGASLSGRVVDAAGRGIRASVIARGWMHRERTISLPRWETDAQGRFDVGALPDGQAMFEVAVPGVGVRRGIGVRTPVEGELVLQFRLPEGGAVAGRVSETDGNSVAGARVLVHLRRRDLDISVAALAVTDAEGRYRIEGLDPGRVEEIEVDAPGHAPVSGLYGGFPLEAGATLLADVVLVRGAIVRGRTLDEKGAPVSGAVVRLSIREPSTRRLSRGTRRSIATDGDGHFEFEGLTPGGVGTLRAHAPHAATIAVEGDGETIYLVEEGQVVQRDLVLRSIREVRGRVEDEAGHPVSGAHVQATSRESRNRESDGVPRPVAVSDEEGRFVLAGLVPGESWTLEARGDALRSEPLAAVPIPLPPTPVPAPTLLMRRGAALRGRVVDANGAGLPGHRVSLRGAHPEGMSSGSLSVETDAEGAFAFERLRAGHYELPPGRWDGGGDGRAKKGFDLAWGQVVDGITLVRDAPLVISGVVVDQHGEPASGVQVQFRRSGATGPRSPGLASSTAGGHFRLRVVPGTYGVWVRGGEIQDSVEAGTTGLRLEMIRPPRRELSGTVVDAQGRSVPQAKVTVYVRVGDATRGRGTTCTVGRFFVGIESQKAVGDVVVSQARDAAGRLLNLRPQVLTGVALDGGEVRIQLEPGLRIQGRVIDLDGKGIPNVRIESRHTRRSDDRLSGYGQHLDSPAAITDAEGRFALRGLDEEPLRITARPRAPWMRPDAQVVVPGADAIEFQLQRGHALAGRVLDPFGAPLAEVTVVVRWRGGSKSTRTAADGAFRLTAIGAGPLVVKVDGGYAGYWPYRPLELQDVEPDRLDLELRLEAGSALSGVVVDPDGKPVRGATVFVSGTTQPPITVNLRTDAAGRFVAADLEPGAYGLVALAHGFANSPRLHVDVPAQDVRLQLGRTWAFHGNVVGRPEARVQLWFCYELGGEPQVKGIGFAAAEPFSFHVPTNQAGTLLLTIEETGEYALVENAKPGTGPHRLVPQPGWTIEGRFEGGAPKPGSTQVSGIDPRGIRIRGQVQADGTFRIRGVAPGAYDLEAWADVGQGLRRFVAEGVDAGAKGIILHPAP